MKTKETIVTYKNIKIVKISNNFFFKYVQLFDNYGNIYTCKSLRKAKSIINNLIKEDNKRMKELVEYYSQSYKNI